MSQRIKTRPATRNDYNSWARLYEGYARFYNVPMTEEIKQTVWGWIHDPDHVVECILAVDGADFPCGLAHVRAMPSPLRGAEVGFLDDLFVDPAMRGSGAAKQLFEALQEHGRNKGWAMIRWITADDNYRARGLYDQVSSKTLWNTYQMEIS